MVCQSVCSFANEDARDHSSIIAITKEKDLQENSIQKLLLQLAHNAGDMSFWRKDVYEGLYQVFPSSNTHDEKLRKIGRILVRMTQDGLIVKTTQRYTKAIVRYDRNRC